MPQWRAGQGEEYVRKYPPAEKWIQQCVNCQTRGLKPETPPPASSKISTEEYIKTRQGCLKNLRKYFKVIELDDRGLCEFCR